MKFFALVSRNISFGDVGCRLYDLLLAFHNAISFRVIYFYGPNHNFYTSFSHINFKGKHC